MTAPVLPDLIAALPEAYQPIYGHPELSAEAQRGCEDRLASVLAVYEALSGELGRPLRVLDLGCAQGWFSLQLAARGASCRGIDADGPSVALCQALAASQPDFDVQFEQGTIEEVLDQLQPGEVDLVLGLSVFHHLVHKHGFDPVRERLERLLDRVAAAVLELAVNSEPLYWAASLRDDPRALLVNIPFVHELSRHPTHLSDIERPLLVASQRHWILPPEAGVIDAFLREPHAYAADHYRGSRRYYRSGERLIKLFRYDVDADFDNAGELAREAQFLNSPPPAISVPAMYRFAESAVAGWLVRGWQPGELLSECLQRGLIENPGPVLVQVLDQLAMLEAAGLYHDDLRVWNLLRLEDGAIVLIDYGSIVDRPGDRAWPGNLWLSFIIFVHELVSGELAHPEPLRPAAISPWGLPEPFRAWLADFWDQPFSDWSFAALRESLVARLDDEATDPAPAISQQPEHARIAALQSGISLLARHGDYLHWQTRQQKAVADDDSYRLSDAGLRLDAVDEHLDAIDGQLTGNARQFEAIEKMLAELLARFAAHDARSAQLTQELDEAAVREQEARAQALALEDERNALLGSASWRVTAPLRAGLSAGQWCRDSIIGWPQSLSRLGRSMLHGLAGVVVRHPPLRSAGLKVLARFPRLRNVLERQLLSQAPPGDSAVQHEPVPPPEAVVRLRGSLRPPEEK